MSALVRRIRRTILSDVVNKNQALKADLEELGITGGDFDPHAELRLQQIILNNGRDSEAQLRRAFRGLDITGGGSGGREVARIRQALLRSGRLADLRSAIDDLIDAEGGGNDYVASAVNLDGSTYLQNDALSCTNSRYITFSAWIKKDVELNEGGVLIAADGENEANNVFNFGSLIAEPPDPAGKTFTFESGTNPFTLSVEALSERVPSTGWGHVLYTHDTLHAAGQKIVKLRVNDDDIAFSAFSDEDDAFIAAWSGLITTVGTDDGFLKLIADVADMMLWVGTSILTVGDISEAHRRLFIDANGKPVDPFVAVAALGAPTILFSGGAGSFATNQGNGGAFVVAEGALTDASTSPSD